MIKKYKTEKIALLVCMFFILAVFVIGTYPAPLLIMEDYIIMPSINIASKVFSKDKNELLYHFYMWRLRNLYGLDGEHMYYMDEITKLAPKVIHLCMSTYRDEKKDYNNRWVAGICLIEADKDMAVDMFVNLLSSENTEVLSTAIYHLGLAKSNKAYKEILPLLNHSDKKVKDAAKYYFEQINDKPTKEKTPLDEHSKN